MAFKVFLDTNIFLDHFLSRNEHSSLALEYCESGDLQGFASSASFYMLAYILSKKHSTEKTKEILSKYVQFIVIIPTTPRDLNLAFSSNFNDLEDAFQYFTALNESTLEYFLTNNLKDFKSGTVALPVISPKDFLRKSKF